MNEYELRAKSLIAMANGRVPIRPHRRMWAASGTHGICPICEEPISPAESHFEVEFSRNGETSRLESYRFHVDCFAAWELEREQART